MKKIFIALLLALLIGCEPNGIQTTEHTSLLTSVDTSIEQTTTQVTTTQVTTTASIISPNDYIDGIHISSYWYSVMDEDEKWGFVDLDGDIIIPFICDEPATFENGTAIVNIRGLKGVINFLGNNVLVPRFAEIESLNHGLFYATSLNEEDFVIYDNEGNQVFSVAGIDSYISLNSDSVLGYKIGSSYGLISVEGDIITDTIFDRIQPFHEDIAAVEVNNLWGFINPEGEYTINPTYLDVTKYESGIVSVLDSTGLWTALNSDETPGLAFEQKSQVPFEFNEFGLSLFEENDLVGQIDMDGTIILDPLYESKYGNFDFDEVYMDSSYELIFNPEGGILYQTNKSYILSFVDDAIILQNKITDLYAAIHLNGQFIVFPMENSIYFRSDFNGDYMIVEPLPALGDYYNLYDLNDGSSNQEPIHGDYPSFNVRGTVFFNKAEMSRVITFDGYPMFEEEFSLCIFLEDVIIISDGELMGIVNYYGKEIIPMEYLQIYNFKVVGYIFQNIQYSNRIEE